MRSSIFHSDRSGTGWSAGDNRWSQLFRWPGKSSNRPGPKNCAAHQKYSMDEKKKKGKKKKSPWLHVRIIVTGVRSLQIFSKQWPGPRETVNFHFDFSFDICRTKWKSRIHPVPIDRFFISFSSSVYHRPSPSYSHKSATRCLKVISFNFHYEFMIIYSPVISTSRSEVTFWIVGFLIMFCLTGK